MLAHIHIHPIVVHFPIALFISAFGLEVLSLILKKEALRKAAWYNYLLAVLASFAAVMSALIEGETLKHSVFYTHRTLGYVTLTVAFLSSIVLILTKRKSVKTFRIVFFVFLIIMAFLVSITSYYGGRLVYEYGVGVEE